MLIKLTIMIIIIGWLSTIKNFLTGEKISIWKNLIKILISLELILIGLAIWILNISINNDELSGAITTIYILTVGAAETAIGLSIIIKYNKITDYEKI